MQLCLDFCDVLRVDNIGIGAPGDFDRDVAWADDHGRQTAARMVVVHIHRQCVRAWCRDQSGLRGMDVVDWSGGVVRRCIHLPWSGFGAHSPYAPVPIFSRRHAVGRMITNVSFH